MCCSKEEYRLFEDEKSDKFRDFKIAMEQFEKEFPDGKLAKIKLVYGNQISISEAVHETISQFPPNTIVLTSTATTEFYDNFVHRVRTNVIKGKQIYAPIAFWQYQPNLIGSPVTDESKRIQIKRSIGHFSDTAFDHLAFFVKDFEKAKRQLSATPLSIYDVLRSVPHLTIFRAPDPECIVRYKKMHCISPNNMDRQVCKAQLLDNIGSGPILAKKLLEEGIVR